MITSADTVIAQVLPCFGKIAFYEVAQIIHFSNLISLEEALSLPSILSSRYLVQAAASYEDEGSIQDMRRPA
jgi:hypothetical protein